MAKRKSRSGMGGGSSSAISNDYQSEYGLPNVGNLESFTSFSGSTVRGTVEPGISDVQAYFDTGAFDNWGTNSAAKRQIAERITRDMSRRGFHVTLAEDGVHILPVGDTGKTITIGRQNDKWVAKQSTSSGTKKRGGMKGVLDEVGKK